MGPSLRFSYLKPADTKLLKYSIYIRPNQPVTILATDFYELGQKLWPDMQAPCWAPQSL